MHFTFFHVPSHFMEVESHVGGGRDPLGHDGIVLGGGPAVFLAQSDGWRPEKRHEGSREEAKVGPLDGELLRELRQPVGSIVVDDPVGFRPCILEERTQLGLEQIEGYLEKLLLDMRHIHGGLSLGRKVVDRREREGDEVDEMVRHFDCFLKVSWA